MGHHTHPHLGATVHDKGVDFAVWAPFAKNVSLLLTIEFDAQEIPMRRTSDGIWWVEDVSAKPGQSYRYRIISADGTVLDRNDPHARQLTDSDTGASVIVVRDFEWEGAEKFVETPHNEAVIYELHVGTFNKPDASTPGTLHSAIEKLDYLAGLGVNYIELMPVTSMATGYGWGYAPNYIFSVENAYGGRRGLLDFVKACHQKGIGVILDVVYNHFYPESDLWKYDGWSENNRGGIYFFNDERGDTPWGGRPDYGRKEVRQFILDNVTMWLAEFKIDGLRLDSTIYMRTTDGDNDNPDQAIPEAWSLLSEINTLARKINPNALMIAEDNSTNNAITEIAEQNGAGFNSQWEVGFPHIIRKTLGIGQDASTDDATYLTEHSYGTSGFDRVVYSDSHDTAANGSVRINEAATPGNAESSYARQQTIVASTLTLTVPGIPMILQGQEFMQEGAFNDWQMLEWSKTEQFKGIVLAHQHLIDLRQNRYDNTAGLTGHYSSLFHNDTANKLIAYHRKNNGGPHDDTVIIANVGDTTLQQYKLSFPSSGRWVTRFNSSWSGYGADAHETTLEAAHHIKDTLYSIDISARSAIILSLE